jgi:hypothetical protein
LASSVRYGFVIVGRRVAVKQSRRSLKRAAAVADSSQPTARAPKATREKARPFVFGISFVAAMGFFMVNIVDPYSGATASPEFQTTHDRFADQPIQKLAVETDYANTISRDQYTVKEKPKPPPPPPVTTKSDEGSSSSARGSGAPAAGTPDPGSAQAYAQSVLASRGLGDDEFSCLVALWNRESHWNVYAYNSSSGAYGIPQALPGSKMASAGADWETSFVTQVNWGLGYVFGRYGSPCGAWQHSESSGWY